MTATAPYLPRVATLEQAQAWLEHETGQQWPLARLLEETGIMPRVWLDYSRDAPPEVFAGRLEGYLAPLMFAGDTQRLAAGADEIVITMTESADGQLMQMAGMRCPLSELRFMADDLRENARICKEAATSGATEKAAPPVPGVAPAGRGITKQQVMNAFEGMVYTRDRWKANLANKPSQWLAPCKVACGNEKTSALWNPALIAAALHDKGIALKRLDAVFVGLKDWADEWGEISAIFRD